MSFIVGSERDTAFRSFMNAGSSVIGTALFDEEIARRRDALLREHATSVNRRSAGRPGLSGGVEIDLSAINI